MTEPTFAPLVGSDKQVAWAEKIRKQIYRDLEFLRICAEYEQKPTDALDRSIALLCNETRAAYLIWSTKKALNDRAAKVLRDTP